MGSWRIQREYWFYEGLSTHLRLCGYIWFGECDIQFFIHTHEFILVFLKVPTKVREQSTLFQVSHPPSSLTI